MDDGVGMANRRYAVDAADWESMGGGVGGRCREDGGEAGLDRHCNAPNQSGSRAEGKQGDKDTVNKLVARNTNSTRKRTN